MVDVVVDEKPMAKLPYDPEVIPPAVRKRAEAVNALYTQQNTSDVAQQPSEGQPEPAQARVPAEAPAVQVPASSVPPPTPAQVAPATSPPAPAEDENTETWKQKFVRINGANTALRKTIGEMQNQMEQMGTELMHVQQRPQQSKRAPVPTPQFLTPEDEQNYGRDLLDVAQRAAMQTVAPKIHEIELQNKDLQNQLARERRRALDQAVELSVPDFRDIDRNPRWHRWLLGIDVYTGNVRQRLLDDAIAAASAPRVISFFNGFKAEEAATGHIESPASTAWQASAPREPTIPLASLATPGRARSATGGDASLPTDKPTYTRVQIRDLYSANRKGAYVGREAEWNRLEADLFAAQREGRIR
jgi:hypothetical protein